MNKERMNNNKKLFNKKIAYWQKVLGLAHFTIYLDLVDQDYMDNANKPYAQAYIGLDTIPYQEARIIINQDVVDNSNADEVIIHELLHLFVAPLANLAKCRLPNNMHGLLKDEVERLTTSVAKAVEAAYKKGKADSNEQNKNKKTTQTKNTRNQNK